MGWYHVNREGKGYCLGSEYDLKLDMEELGKYLPDRSETENVLRQTAKDAVDTYDEWPLLWKFATLDPDQTGPGTGAKPTLSNAIRLPYWQMPCITAFKSAMDIRWIPSSV